MLFAILAKSDREGRAGPPESAEKPGKAGKRRKQLFPRFLRGTRAVVQGVSPEAIVTHLARYQQAGTGHLCSSEDPHRRILCNRYRSTSAPRRSRRSSDRAPGALASSAVGEALLPPHPHPIVRIPAGTLPPLFRSRRRRSPVSPLQGGRES